MDRPSIDLPADLEGDGVFRPTFVSRAASFRASWCDGFWLLFEFAIAFALCISIPSAILAWAWKFAPEGLPKTLVSLCGAAFLTIAAPILFSRLFRELEFPRGSRASEESTGARRGAD